MLLALAAFAFLIASSLWAQRRFARFAKLPMQYNIRMKPTWYAPRWLAIWLTTGVFAAVIALNLGLATMVDPRFRNGDPETGIVLTSVLIVLVQIFILWLHSRWARNEK